MYTASFDIFHNSLFLVSIVVNLGNIPFESVQSDSRMLIFESKYRICPREGERIPKKARLLFYTLEEGEKAGYHSCKYCSAIGQYYRKEKTKIKQFCEENKMLLQHENREIHVQMPLSQWKIVGDSMKGLSYFFLLFQLHFSFFSYTPAMKGIEESVSRFPFKKRRQTRRNQYEKKDCLNTGL